MLLNHVKKATSFKDLRKVSGVVYSFYKAIGLLDDDKEGVNAFYEAIATATSL